MSSAGHDIQGTPPLWLNLRERRCIELNLKAKLSGFDPIGDSHLRWGYDGNRVKLVKDVVAEDRVTFQLPASEKGELVRIWVAASSKGIGVGNPNPFVQQPPEQAIGNMTFVTTGSAVAAMRPWTVEAKCGDGDIQLKHMHVRRTYCTPDGTRKDETITKEGPIETLRFASGITNQYFDYDVSTVLKIQAPNAVRLEKPFDVSAAFEVTWTIRKFTAGIDHWSLNALASIEDYDKGHLQSEAKPTSSGAEMPGTHRTTVAVQGRQGRGGSAGGNERWIIAANAYNPMPGCNDEIQVVLWYDIFGP